MGRSRRRGSASLLRPCQRPKPFRVGAEAGRTCSCGCYCFTGLRRAPVSHCYAGVSSSGLSAPHSRLLTATGGCCCGRGLAFGGRAAPGEGRGGGGGAVAGGGAVCPGTERPRPWRTPISSSTSSSATQVRAPDAAERVSAANRPRLSGRRQLAAAPRRRRRPAPPSGPRCSISAVLELVTWALREPRPGRAGFAAPAPSSPAARDVAPLYGG